VLTETLIDEGIQLEMNLIKPRRKVHRQRLAEHLRLHPVHKARRQTKINEIRRTRVQPIRRDQKVPRYLITSVDQTRGKWRPLEQRAILDPRDHIHIPRRPIHHPKRQQARAANHHELVALSLSGEALGESDKKLVQTIGA